MFTLTHTFSLFSNLCKSSGVYRLDGRCSMKNKDQGVMSTAHVCPFLFTHTLSPLRDRMDILFMGTFLDSYVFRRLGLDGCIGILFLYSYQPVAISFPNHSRKDIFYNQPLGKTNQFNGCVKPHCSNCLLPCRIIQTLIHRIFYFFPPPHQLFFIVPFFYLSDVLTFLSSLLFNHVTMATLLLNIMPLHLPFSNHSVHSCQLGDTQ